MRVISRATVATALAVFALGALPAASARPLHGVISSRGRGRRTVGVQATVPVQLIGVRPGAGRVWAAVVHAIHRDAMASLNACATALPAARGEVHVELSHRETGRWIAEVNSARRDRALEACIRQAVDNIAVPPRDDLGTSSSPPCDNSTHLPPRIETLAPTAVAPDSPTEDLVAFDLAFAMPAVVSQRR